MVRNTHSQFTPLAKQHFETPRHQRKAPCVFADNTGVMLIAGFSSKAPQIAAFELQPSVELLRAEDTQGSVHVPFHLPFSL